MTQSIKSKMDFSRIELVLVQWGKELGGKDQTGLDWPRQSVMQTVLDHHGFSPSKTSPKGKRDRTPTDDIEDIVREMENIGSTYYQAARALRCDYFRPDMAIDSRLDLLSDTGTPMGRSKYYSLVDLAKAYVTGAYFNRSACG